MDDRVRRPARAAAPATTIRELVSYRLHQVTLLLSRGAALQYRREFGVSLGEWRTVALLGAQARQSLNQLAAAAGLDKSQMSRVVSGLSARGIVDRAEDSADGRGVRLSLTRAGRRLYDGLIAAARARDAAFLGVLSADERDQLDAVLAKLGERARGFIEHESSLAQGARRMSR